jgi:hypothetical protein
MFEALLTGDILTPKGIALNQKGWDPPQSGQLLTDLIRPRRSRPLRQH